MKLQDMTPEQILQKCAYDHGFNDALDEVLEIMGKVIEEQVKQAERFNGSGWCELAKIHQDQADGVQVAKQAIIEALRGGEQR